MAEFIPLVPMGSFGSGAMKGAAGSRAGGFAGFEDGRATHEDVVDAFGGGSSRGVGGPVGHGDGVEDGDVGDEAGAEEATVGESEPPRSVGGQVGHGLGPGVVAELPGVVAEVA